MNIIDINEPAPLNGEKLQSIRGGKTLGRIYITRNKAGVKAEMTLEFGGQKITYIRGKGPYEGTGYWRVIKKRK